MKVLKTFTFAILITFCLELAADAVNLIPTSEKFCEELATLPTKGFLQQVESGDIILKISDEYLERICAFIDYPSEDYLKPSVGAHISVFRPVFDGIRLTEIPELNQEFSFEVMGFAGVVPLSDRFSYVWFLLVHSPELTNLRLKYGLEPYLHGDHAFHITLGLKPIKQNNDYSKCFCEPG